MGMICQRKQRIVVMGSIFDKALSDVFNADYSPISLLSENQIGDKESIFIHL